ncbi:MAG: tetratricopeptide repeat protein [Anaerolineales bacterium]|nr:tetratricopeptide repeat protein [Anaerolineales bacterium]
MAFEETEALEVDPTALIGGLVVTIIGGIIVVLVQKWLESREKQRKKDALVPEEVTPPKLPTPKIPNNLPQPGEFIGREREKAEVREALASRSFLISIDGIGGIGKTALALEAVHECLQASKDEILANGVPTFDAFVWTTAKDRELALSDILDTIARTLDYPYIAQLPPEEKSSEAAKLLRAQKCLLIVDNFETITDDAVRDFLLNLPNPSRALVTSREQRLRQARAISLRGLEQSEALALIRSEGKHLGLPAVEKADQNVLLRLYEATGGAPLAIKWAVGQMKQRGQSLDTVLDYLYGARSAIFENIFARSWELLSENARRVLVVMSIFATSASKPAIEAASDVHKWDLHEALGQLVEMWLVEASEGLDEARRRYSIHPLTRAFVGERLGEDTDFEKGARLRTVEHFLAFVKGRGGSMKDDWTGYETFEVERENILKVMDWCIDSEEWELFKQMWKNASRYFWLHGYLNVLTKYQPLALEACKKQNDWPTYALTLLHVGWRHMTQSRYQEAERYCLEAKEVYGRREDRVGVALTLRTLGLIELKKGDLVGAKEFLQQSYDIAQEVNDLGMMARVKKNLGDVAYFESDYGEAYHFYEEVLSLNREREDLLGISVCLTGLGNSARELGNLTEARNLFEL